MKKIVMLRSNPINPDPRVEKEVAALIKGGYKVTVVAWNREKNDGCKESYFIIDGNKVPIVKMGYKATFGEGMKNWKAYLKFQFSIFWYLMHNRYYDIIHASDFDTGFIANFAAILTRKKFVFDIYDFIAGRPENTFQRIIKMLQFAIINRADATIICTEKRREQIEGSHPKKLIVIHNTPSKKNVKLEGIMRKRQLTGVDSVKMKLVYVGILQDYRLLKEVLVSVSENPKVELHIGGFGKYENLVKQYHNNYENIIFYGKLSYEETISLENQSDIMLAIYDPGIENHVYAAPNKFYEGLMLGKPLIMVRETGMSEVVKENNIGVLIEYSKFGFENGLTRILAMKSDWVEMGERMQKLYEEKYSWEIMERRLINLYDKL